MSRRCPNCGGLVGVDARWCGQCLTPLEEAGSSVPASLSSTPSGPPPDLTSTFPPSQAPAPAGVVRPSGSSAPIRSGPTGAVWECPACRTENPIEATTCRVCGTPFARLLEEERRGPALEPGRAVSRSLLFPGLGHAAAGRGAEGLARAVVFGYALAIVMTVLVMRSGEGFGPFLPLVLISAAAGIALYALSAVDAGRLARGEQQVLSSRALLYGAVGLMLVTIVILVIVGTRVGGQT
jgi:hypothetical protein